MKITVNNLQKKFGRQHILQNIRFELLPGTKNVILGANGSGKSTLLKILSGALEVSDHPPIYEHAGHNIEPKQIGKYCGIAAPYVALNPMFTLIETLDFHEKMCGFHPGFDRSEWLIKAGLAEHKNKRLSTFSSGMQQRVRLILAAANERPLLLLDEPTSNLDKDGIEFYQDLVATFSQGKTVLVASNHIAHEYEFCTDKIKLEKHY